MNSHYSAPHQGRSNGVQGAPNAALLIDFDNVTMGIRSDLTKELKSLLNSDIIKGKVAVHRAYADWRRYPQYIVPLSEASVDLIFAPAYGSSKKNATDIRLAIDALELVFTRPEIGTFILLSGDSDFSSLVLKLKEYGKYVIGVGIKESSSDLLVQNCDEYYSYNALTGLTKAGEEKPSLGVDPWDLVEKAVERMVEQNDVMRSDRLKQVMLELDSNFDEKELGYSKYNKFLTDAASRGKLKLRKLENGQFEVGSTGRGRGRSASGDGSRQGKQESRSSSAPALGMDESYALLKRAARDLADRDGEPVRDSDVKRRMLEIESGWDESALGFAKFSHFLRQAHNSEVIDLRRGQDGIYEVVVPGAKAPAADEPEPRAQERDRSERGGRGRGNGRGRDRKRGRDEREDERPRARREPEAQEKSPDAGPRERAEETPPDAGTHEQAEPAGNRAGADARQDEPSRKVGRVEVPAEQVAAAQQEAASPPSTSDRDADPAPEKKDAAAAGRSGQGIGRGMRRGGRRAAPEGPPPLLEGQTVSLGSGSSGPEDRTAGGAAAAGGSVAEPTASSPAEPAASSPAADGSSTEAAPDRTPETPPAGDSGGAPHVTRVEDVDLDGVLDARELGLPVDAGAVQRYLTNRYRGVGDKTAEAVIQAFGAERVFAALQGAPERVVEVLGGGRRAAALMEAWEQDYARRSGGDTSSSGDGGATG